MSSECRRYEEEGLLLQLSGQPLGPHFTECADCLKAQAAYGKVQQGLSQANAEENAGDRQWEAKVWAEIRRREAKKTQRRLWPFAAASAVAFAAVVVMVVLPTAATAPSLDVGVQPSRQQTLRGTQAQPGDVLTLSAQRGEHAHAVLWVFRDGRLAFACGGTSAPACDEQAGKLTAEVPMEAVGQYRPVLVLSQQPLKLEEGADAAAQLELAAQAGAQVLRGESVDVY